MKKFLKDLPIEVYVILFSALIFIIVIFILTLVTSGQVNLLHGHFISTLLRQTLYSTIVIPIFVYISLSFAFFYMQKQNDHPALLRRIRSFLFVIAILVIANIITSLGTQVLFNTANAERAVSAGRVLTQADYTLTGTYPWLTLHSIITSQTLEVFVLNSYLWLFSIMVIMTTAVIFLNTRLFRKFILALFLAYIIGIPCWVAVPALSPDEMYRVKLLNTVVPSDIAETLTQTNFSSSTEKVLTFAEKYWVDPTRQSVNITSFPSMHSAWGVIVAVIGIELWAPLAIILVPWVTLELIGTFYSLQHYTVDTLLGIVVGLCALWLASFLLRLEDKYFTNSYNLFSSLHHLEEQTKKVWRKFVSKITSSLYN